tara:strand:+ start:3677 stop:4765 length:1089 start_codon:yes stop_codon:yes gene_type:complete
MKVITPLKKIIHVDMDAFFAAVEQRDNPELRGKPVIVGGKPGGRGVVSTCSYEARKFGVHSAMPTNEAYRLCPHGIFVKSNFEAYKEASTIIREIFFEYTDLVEPLSMDEAYLDVTENHKGNPSATLIAREIRARIFEETQLTASAGVAPNKFIAKVASDFNKPNGLTVITPDKMDAFLEELDIKKFFGVGKATQKKMHALGIKTGADLKKWTEIDLVKAFGKSGRYYYKIVRGIDNREVKPHRTRKSYGKERTFSEDVNDLVWVNTFLDELAQSISEGMQKIPTAGKTITLKVRYKNFDTITRSQSLTHYTNKKEEISTIVQQLLEQTEAASREIRLLGISLSNLNLIEKDYFEQLELGIH